MSDWEEYLLEDLADEITVGFVGSMADEYVEKGITFLRSKNVDPHRINLDDIRYITPEFHQKLKKSALTPGDVVIVRTGKPGAASIIPDYLTQSNCSDLVIVRPSSNLDRHFLVYYLNSIAVHYINSYLVGAVQQHFNIGAARKLKITLPKIKEQKRIADVLSCVDAKIDNLRRQNETLEEIGRSIFKHWFIDFEFPNADGKPYKSSGSAMVRSELGDIPEGWRVGNIKNIMTLNYGKSLIAETRIKGKYPVIGSNGIVDTHNDFFVTAPGIVIGRKGTIGKVIWVEKDFYPIDTTFYIQDILGCNGLYFHYFVLKNQNFSRLTSDSAVPGLNRDMAYSVELVIPIIEQINEYNLIAKTVSDKVSNNSNQIQVLTKTRDGILPKLMSGQLHVKE